MSDSDIFSSAGNGAKRSTIATVPAAGNRALWFAVFAPPAAWTIALLLSIALHHDFCAAVVGHSLRPWSAIALALTIVAVLSLVLSACGGVAAWRVHARLGSDDGFGITDIDRRRFMARAGLLSCALFSYGIILIAITHFVIPVTWCS